MNRVAANVLHSLGAVGGLVGLCWFASTAAYSAPPSDSAESSSRQVRSGELPPLAQAREAGRAKSALLSPASQQLPPMAPGIPEANLAGFKQHVAPVLATSCVACHGPDTAEGNLRVDQLNPDLLHGPDIQHWLSVYGALTNGEMPPADEPAYHLADESRAKVIDWLGQEIHKASQVQRRQRNHSSFRRLTRYEYNYALQDLLGLPHQFAHLLPPESSSEDGFQNSSELLQMSAMQFETCRAIGLKALKTATVQGERPKMVVYRMTTPELAGPAGGSLSVINEGDIGELHPLNPEAGNGGPLNRGKPSLKLNLDRFLPDEGIMRVRIRAGRTTMKPDEYASLRLIFSAHTSNNANFSQVISERDMPVTASAENPEFIHFDIRLGEIQRNPFRKLATTFPRRDEFLTIQNVTNANGKEPLSVQIDFIEICAPFYEQWPPKTHTDIFFDSPNRGDEKTYAREVLTKFIERAWRRPVTPEEVQPFLTLFAGYRTELTNFEDALVEVLATILATPEFLYLTQRVSAGDAPGPDRLSDVELASRLSFFLWSSLPDEELLQLARQEKLKDAGVLTAQVERMLADPRSARFSQHFVEQWLGLDGLNSVTHIKDESLLQAMREEPVAFFNEVLRHNHSVLDLIHSDYAVLNERLASHYRIPGVYGPHFRKVSIAPESNRGGILTGAGVLSMNSDGTDSHPVKRGVWLLERVLRDPPPPPPPNVPEVDLTDPRILEMTLKERIADHRNKAACMSCHAKIDPWGIAFENYDALGAWRTQIKNQPVDATSALFNRQKLEGMDGLKRYLLTERQDQLAGAMVDKMTSYALGRPLSFSDHADLDSLTRDFRRKEDRLRDLIHLIVNSPIFHSR